MSILDFSDKLFSISIESSSLSTQLGSFTNDLTVRQLGHIRVLMFFDGLFNAESVILSVVDDPFSPSVTWASSSVKISSLDPVLLTDSAWLGWVRFDFGKQFIDASTEYFLLMDAANYTETDSLSINLVYDYPIPMNGTRLSSFQKHPVAFEVYGYER